MIQLEERCNVECATNRTKVDLAFEACLTFLNGGIAEFDGSFDRPFEANHGLEPEKAHIKIRIFFFPYLASIQ